MLTEISTILLKKAESWDMHQLQSLNVIQKTSQEYKFVSADLKL